MIATKNQTIRLTAVAIAGLLLSACEADFDNPVSGSAGSSGDADLSKFVTVGDSLTAGYADAALYLSGQQNSYPAILAQQFAKVGGDNNFTQPLVDDNLGGLLFAGNTHPDFGNRLVLNAETSSPEAISGIPTTEVIGSGLNGSTFNNMGVPGAKSFHLGAPGYGNPAGLPAAANPYFVRFASSTTSTMITDAASQQPSFFVMWIGNNDVLSYATSGGVGINQVGNYEPASYGANDITDPLVFAGSYAALVGEFLAANANVQGVLVNIPDISTIPYFTTVLHNPVPLDQVTASALNDFYDATYNAAIAVALAGDPIELAKRTISFIAGHNAVVIEDEDLTDLTGAGIPSIRQATAEDLLMLTTSSIIGELVNPLDDALNPASPRWGISAPLTDGDVLIPSEIAAINTARAAFNATIKAAAEADPNLVLVDADALMQEISNTGVDYGTGLINAKYAVGGSFSLDGVHPTARGYAVVANRIIEAVNEGFNASIPTVNPGDYTTIFIK